MKRYLIISGLSLVFLSACLAAFLYHRGSVLPTENDDSISIVKVGEPSNRSYENVRKAVDSFNPYLHEHFGVQLSHPVRLYLAETDKDYVKALQDIFRIDTDEAVEISALSGGWTGGEQYTTIINASANVMKTPDDCISTTGHELFHQLQYQLSDGNNTAESSFFWIDEGSADYFGALLAESLTGRSADQWIADVEDELLFTNTTADPMMLQHLDLSERKKVMQKDLHSYQMADLMTWYLLQTYAKEDGFSKLIAYYKALAETKNDGSSAFEQTFHISLGGFLQSFQIWWIKEQKNRMTVSFHQSGSDHAIQEKNKALQREFDSSIHFIENKTHRIFRGTYTLYLATNKKDMGQILQRERGVEEAEASDLAEKSLWFQSGSVIVLNTTELNESDQQIFTLTALAMRLFLAQQMDDGSGDIAWLTRGLSYVMATRRLIDEKKGDEAAYQQAWVNSLRKAGSNLSLEALESSKQYMNAASGTSTKENKQASVLSELAAWLLTKKGTDWNPALRWTEQVRHGRDKEGAFQSAFGEPLSTFYARVNQLLSQK